MASDASMHHRSSKSIQSFNPLIGLLWLLTLADIGNNAITKGFNPLIGLLWLLTGINFHRYRNKQQVSIP